MAVTATAPTATRQLTSRTCESPEVIVIHDNNDDYSSAACTDRPHVQPALDDKEVKEQADSNSISVHDKEVVLRGESPSLDNTADELSAAISGGDRSPRVSAAVVAAAAARNIDGTMCDKVPNVFFDSVPVARREPSWARRRISVLFRVYKQDRSKIVYEYKGKAARDQMGRPSKDDVCIQGRRVAFVNFEDSEPKRDCEEFGLACCPCANPECFGTNGAWHTAPVKSKDWFFHTPAHKILVEGGDGSCTLVVSRRSLCSDCGTTF